MNNIKKILKIYLTFLFLVTTFNSSIVLATTNEQYQKVNIITTYSPNIKLAGLAFAKYSNSFLDNGILVSIDNTNSNSKVLDLVSSGKKQFGIMNANDFFIYYAESEKTPNIIVVGSTIVKTKQFIVAKKSSGIKKITDLENKKIAISIHNDGTSKKYKIYELLLKKNKVKAGKIVYQKNYTVMPLLFDAVDAMLITDPEELFACFTNGLNDRTLEIIPLEDKVLENIPESFVIVNRDFYNLHPILTQKLLKLLTQGWQNAANPNKITDVLKIINKSVVMNNSEFSYPKEVWLLKHIGKNLKPKVGMDIMTKENFENIINMYYNNNIIPTKLNYNKIFSRLLIKQ